MKRTALILFAIFSLVQAVQATVISGTIVDLTGQPMTSNRTVTFTLENCGTNIPMVVGSSVVAPATKTISPNAAGLLTGTIIGNDIISCGTVVGQTWYTVQIFQGFTQLYSQNYLITGPTWNITTAVPISNDPTAFMDLGGGYLLGDMLYGSGSNTLGVIRGNTSSTPRVLVQTGDGTHSAPPIWTSITEITSSTLPPLSGDLNNSGGNSAQITVATVGGSTAAQIHAAVLAANAATSANVPGTAVMRDSSGNFAAGMIIGTLNGNAATVTDGVYTNQSYTNPGWLTITPAGVGLSNVENTKLSTWIGSNNVTTVGQITIGAWKGSPIADAYIASSAIWNAKQNTMTAAGVVALWSGCSGSELLGADQLCHASTGSSGFGVDSTCSWATFEAGSCGSGNFTATVNWAQIEIGQITSTTTWAQMEVVTNNNSNTNITAAMTWSQIEIL